MLLFVDNLTNVDFSFLDPQRGLLGETWLANVRLIGELDEPCNETDLLERVKQTVGIPVIRHSPFCFKLVRKVALCTGSGSFMIREALKIGRAHV